MMTCNTISKNREGVCVERDDNEVESLYTTLLFSLNRLYELKISMIL